MCDKQAKNPSTALFRFSWSRFPTQMAEDVGSGDLRVPIGVYTPHLRGVIVAEAGGCVCQETGLAPTLLI